ncbi:MAG: MFS transporter [Bryobacterales bacterium]|nr:MFS transporter [Bryobacterales bacterium]
MSAAAEAAVLETRSTRRAWSIVFMLFAVACLNYADRTAISSVFPLLKQELGLSDVELAALGSAFLWVYALCSPFAGMLADRYSRTRIIIGSMLAWSAVTILTGLAADSHTLILSRVLLGIAESAYLPAAIALIADHHAPSSRGAAMGLHLCGLNLGLVAGGGLAGYLGEQHGWRVSFFVLGASGFVLALIASRVLEDGPRPRPHTAAATAPRTPILRQLMQLLRTPTYAAVVVEAMTIAIGVWMFFNWMPLYFRETYGMSLAAAGLSGTMTLQLSASLGILVGGFLSDRIARAGAPRRMLFMGICYLVSAPCLLVFYGKFPAVTVSAAIVLFSFGRALAASNEDAILCEVIPADGRATAYGLVNTMNCLAGGAGIMIAGVLKSGVGLSTIFAGISVLVLFSGLVSLAGYRWFMPRDMRRIHGTGAS